MSRWIVAGWAALLSLAPACRGADPAEGADAAANGGADASAAAPGADAGVEPAGCSAFSARQVPAEVVVLPDEGEAPYAEVLSGAQTSIHVFSYLMGTGVILDTLEAKAAAGVEVQVILDVGQDANPKYADELTAAGASVRWSDPVFPYMHAKAIIVDGGEAMVSTGNFSRYYSIEKERNFVAHDRDPQDVADLEALFHADWTGVAPSLPCTRLIVSPINSQARILDLIESATSTLTIESMQFADYDVRDAVAARRRAGVSVRVLLAAPSWIDANTDAAAFLAQQGIPVRSMETPPVHVKAIVVDGERAYIGSENLSFTSLTKNREIGVGLTEPDAVDKVASTFETDWAKAVAFQ